MHTSQNSFLLILGYYKCAKSGMLTIRDVLRKNRASRLPFRVPMTSEYDAAMLFASKHLQLYYYALKGGRGKR